MWQWFLTVLGIAKAVEYLFRCIVCGIEAVLSAADAKRQGWQYQSGATKPKGWYCSKCSGQSLGPQM